MTDEYTRALNDIMDAVRMRVKSDQNSLMSEEKREVRKRAFVLVRKDTSDLLSRHHEKLRENKGGDVPHTHKGRLMI